MTSLKRELPSEQRQDQKQRIKRGLNRCCLATVMVAVALSPVNIATDTNRTPEGAKIAEKIGGRIPLDLSFYGENGEQVTLGTFFETAQHPVVLIPSYYTCAHVCPFIFKGVRDASEAVSANDIVLGADYTVLSVSFDPTDSPALARQKGDNLRQSFSNLQVDKNSWHFLTSDREEKISALMQSLGYGYKKDGKDYSHTTAIVVLTPQAVISRYLYGVLFEERDFRLALTEASQGRLGSTVERILLYCFRYDSLEGRYTPYVWAFVQIGAVATLLFLAGLIFLLLRREKKSSF